MQCHVVTRRRDEDEFLSSEKASFSHEVSDDVDSGTPFEASNMILQRCFRWSNGLWNCRDDDAGR